MSRSLLHSWMNLKPLTLKIQLTKKLIYGGCLKHQCHCTYICKMLEGEKKNVGREQIEKNNKSASFILNSSTTTLEVYYLWMLGSFNREKYVRSFKIRDKKLQEKDLTQAGSQVPSTPYKNLCVCCLWKHLPQEKW